MLKDIKQNFISDFKKAKDLVGLDDLYNKYLGRKGELTDFLKSLKDLSKDKRAKQGQEANLLKKEIEQQIEDKKNELVTSGHKSQKKDWIDVTVPGVLPVQGHLHPITLVQRQIEDIFSSMGFEIAYGPEVESEHYNFDALNIPKDHPARDMWDTFWLKDIPMLLRTHTSPVQARYMEKNNPPLRIIVPGKVFRHEATDASHDAQFYQAEGLMVGKEVSVANFRAIIEEFLRRFFGEEAIIRLRPSYFPFTEPSFEIDVKRPKGDWLEIMGAGMVHPNVFKAVGYDQKKWKGFAFGVGLDRLAMLKYKIDDIRLFHSGDLRFIDQF
ncbi:MAG: phenylalanine--tRNA ligase subunit alpha [bacterium]